MKMNKKTSNTQQTTASTEKKTRTKASAAQPGLQLPVALGLGCLLLACAVIWFGMLEQSQQRASQQLAANYAHQQLGALDKALQQIDRDLALMASSPELQSLLLAGNTRPDSLAHRFHDSLAAYLHAIGKAEQISDERAPVSFAALDMIRRAERNMPVLPEAHQVSGAWRLYMIKPLRSSADAPIRGTLLVVFDMRRILGSLPPLPAGSGELSLVQQFPGTPAHTLLRNGDTSTAEPLVLSTGNPIWRLEFRPGPALRNSLVNPLALGIAALLATLGTLLALLVLQRSWTTQLRKDSHTLAQLTHGHKVAGLHLMQLEPVAQHIMQLARQHQVNPGPSPAREQATRPAAAPTAAPDDFDDQPLLDDVLDIDIMDDDDPFGMQQDAGQPPHISPDIFRAYDIRGVVGRDLDANVVYWLGRAIGSQSQDAGESRVAVARDGRLSGPTLVEPLITGLLDSGCEVVDLDMVPTPVAYYACANRSSGSAVILTGSHNPPDYNGLKIVIAGKTLYGEQVQALRKRIEDGNLHQAAGSRSRLDLLEAYCQRICDDVVLARPLRIVIDCGNGVTGVIAQQLFEQLGCEVTALFSEVDGRFPNHHPDPGNPENLVQLIDSVRQLKADIGLAFDGDGDRVGVVDSKGQIIHPDRLLMLFAEDVLARNPGADILFDVKCTRQLPALISRLGGRPLMGASGHSLIKARMQESGALLAGEMSGHLFFNERWYGFDDGLYAAARLLELLSLQEDDSATLMARYPSGATTPELVQPVDDQRKFALIDALRQQADWNGGRLIEIDGLRVEFPFGWGLVRASNTTPALTLRFEADSNEELQQLQQLFREQLARVAPDISPTF